MNSPPRSARSYLFYRHPLPVRIAHWLVVVSFALLLMSGLQIFNAHPALYWGAKSDFEHPLLAMRAADDSTEQAPRGVTVILGHSFDTTGIFGVSAGPDGQPTERGFPSWLTIPSYQDLATGRRWHFFFAWVLAVIGGLYLLYSLFGPHARRDLVPRATELRHIGGSIREHIRLHFPRGDAARRYNVLQKLSYLLVIFIIFPVLVLAGLAMSPGFDSAVALNVLFGGRQAARTVHFICAWLLVFFALVHIGMVLVSGVFNNLRSMITGYYRIKPESPYETATSE